MIFCKFLSSTVWSDAYLWRHIHIDLPASRERITDNALLQLANRAQGNLRTLSLVKCYKILDDGMKRVLERNPRLIKLNVPGCTRLTVEGILKCFKISSKSWCYDLQQIHFEELKSLISEDSCRQKSNYSMSFGDDYCAMDIELCPRCWFFQMVMIVQQRAAKVKKVEHQSCRARRFSISRCY
ncbi:hypothetical protein MKW92_026110 [Papaver armeniacum]|nr:hypothetical protein MKW92_026110 [Papaver armeniacum]